jgi:hypothetical protein
MSYQFLLSLVDNEPRKDPQVLIDLDEFKWHLSEYYSVVKALQTINEYRYTDEEIAPTAGVKDTIRAEREARRVRLQADLDTTIDEMFKTSYMKRWCPPLVQGNKTNEYRIRELKTRLLNFYYVVLKHGHGL